MMEWILGVEFVVTGLAIYFGLYASVRKNHRDLMFHLSRVLPLAAAILGYIVLFRLDGVPSILALKQSIEFAINPLNGLESLSLTTHVLVRISVFVNQILFYLLFILTVRYFAFWKITIAWANRLWLFIKDPKTPAVYLFTDFNKDQIRPYLRRVLGTFDLTVIASYGAVQSTDEGKEMLLTVRNMRIRAIQEDYSVYTLLRLMSFRNAKFISLFQRDDDNIVFAKTALEALEKKLKFPMSRHAKLKANETKRLDRVLNRYAFFIHYHDAHRYDAFNIESFSMGAVRLVHPDAMNTLHFLVEHPITRITPHLALDQEANRAIHVIGCDAAGSMMLREMMEAYQLPTSHQIDYTVVGANAKTIVDEILFSAALHEVSPEINPYPMREQICVHALPMDLNASLQTTVGIGSYVQNNVMPFLANLDQLSFFVSYGDDLANLRIAKDLQRSLSLSYKDSGTKLKNDNSKCVLFVTIRSHELVEQEIKHNDIDQPSRFVKVEDAIAAKEMFPIVFIGFEGYLHTLLGHPYQDHLVVSRNINFVYSNSDFYQTRMTSEAQRKILPNHKIPEASMMEWMTSPLKRMGYLSAKYHHFLSNNTIDFGSFRFDVQSGGYGSWMSLLSQHRHSNYAAYAALRAKVQWLGYDFAFRCRPSKEERAQSDRYACDIARLVLNPSKTTGITLAALEHQRWNAVNALIGIDTWAFENVRVEWDKAKKKYLSIYRTPSKRNNACLINNQGLLELTKDLVRKWYELMESQEDDVPIDAVHRYADEILGLVWYHDLDIILNIGFVLLGSHIILTKRETK